MKAIMNNRLLLGSLFALVAYWITGYLTPTPYLSSLASLALLVFAAFSAYRYGRTAFEIVVLGRRSGEPGAEGSHLAVYGTALIALGSFYIGVFGLAWVYAGQPVSWLGTPMSGFGRALAAAGFLLLYSSPDVTKTGLRVPSLVLLAIIFAATIGMAFLLGWQMRGNDEVPAESWRFMRMHGADRPMCAPDRPVWVSQGGVFHAPDSPYRTLVVPSRCFRNEGEALAAGYRKPG